jgi:hypothetical protein
MTFAQLQSKFYLLTKTNATSMLAATLNLYMQPALERVVSLILQSDGRWQYDDSNYSDQPIATANLVSGQQDYSLSTSQIEIIGAAVMLKSGAWRELLPFDPADLGTSSSPLSFIPLVAFGPTMDRAEFLKTPALPQYYDKHGPSVILYPAPDNGISVTLTAGLKLYFKRGPLQFDYTTNMFTDSTGSSASVPGFNSLYHDLVAFIAAYDYCVVNLPSLAGGYMSEIQRREAALVADYSKRNEDERTIMSGRKIKYI